MRKEGHLERSIKKHKKKKENQREKEIKKQVDEITKKDLWVKEERKRKKETINDGKMNKDGRKN